MARPARGKRYSSYKRQLYRLFRTAEAAVGESQVHRITNIAGEHNDGQRWELWVLRWGLDDADAGDELACQADLL